MPKIKIHIALASFFLLFIWGEYSHAQDPRISNKGRFEVDYVKGCPGIVVNITAENVQGILQYELTTQDSQVEEYADKRAFTLSTPGVYYIIQNFQSHVGDRRDSVRIEVLEPEIPDFEVKNCGNGIVMIKAIPGGYDYYIVDGNPFSKLNEDNSYQLSLPYNHDEVHQITVKGMFDGPGVWNNCGESRQSVEVVSDLPPTSITEITADVKNQTVTLRHEPLHPNVEYVLEVEENGSGNFTPLQAIHGQKVSLSDFDLQNNFYCFKIHPISPCDPDYRESTYYSNTVCTTMLSGNSEENGNRINYETNPSLTASLTLIRDQEERESLGNTLNGTFLDTEVNCNTSYSYGIQINDGMALSFTTGLELASALNGALPPPENIASNWEGNVPYFEILLSSNPKEAIYKATFGGPIAENMVASSDTNKIALVNRAENSCYQFQYSDNCGNTSAYSKEVCALFLSNNTTQPDVLNFEWNSFQGYKSGISHYELEEYDPQGNLIQSFPLGLETNINLGEQGIEKSGNQYIVKAYPTEESLEITSSNTFVFQIVMKGYFPNAFSPDGDKLNDYFKPEGKFVTGGQLEIFDRWGAAVYKTNDMERGWDGTTKGGEAPQGTYMYKALITTEDGGQQTQQGTVFLMRK